MQVRDQSAKVRKGLGAPPITLLFDFGEEGLKCLYLDVKFTGITYAGPSDRVEPGARRLDSRLQDRAQFSLRS
jgi:hypothetical protein